MFPSSYCGDLKYSTDLSSRIFQLLTKGYYIEGDHFGGATNQDVLLFTTLQNFSKKHVHEIIP